MPPMTATPVAIPKDKEQELDQEFELDIRVTTAPTPVMAATAATGGCCGPTHTCHTDCGTCHTCASICGCPTPATGGCCPHG